MNIKLSNVSRAAISSILGLLILILGTVGGSIAEGQFSLKALAASVTPAIILMVTDFLKETKKKLDEQDTPDAG